MLISLIQAGAVVSFIGAALADGPVPLEQFQIVHASTTTDCEGNIEESVLAPDFEPFNDSVFSFQICDAQNISAFANADLESIIAADSMSVRGSANASGVSPPGMHAFSSSVFEVRFRLSEARRYHATGVISVEFGLAGGHQSQFRLTGPGEGFVFNEGLVGDGGTPQTLDIDLTGRLEPGEYVYSCFGSHQPRRSVDGDTVPRRYV